jgi:hypothetical protein
MLRFEPIAHKETLGDWVRTGDWVSWSFDANSPGDFTLEGLIGCTDYSKLDTPQRPHGPGELFQRPRP